MKKEVIILIAILTITTALFFIFILFYTSYTPSEIKNNTVVNIIDGDTFEIYNSDTKSFEIIRLLCVNTPEKNQEGYEEAKEFLKSLILNKEVNLTSSITDKDVYNRLLRYVYVNQTFVNKEILDNSYGELLIIPPEECKELFE